MQKVRRQKAKKGHSSGARRDRYRDDDDDYPRVVLDIPIASIEMPPTPPADSPSPRPSQAQHRKRRRDTGHRRDDSGRRTGFSTPSPTPESEVEMEIAVKCVDRTYQYDPYDVEEYASNACLPWLVRDSLGNYPHPTDRSKINDRIFKTVISDVDFPNVYDDRKDMVEVEYERVKKKTKGSRAKRARRQAEQSETPEIHESDDEGGVAMQERAATPKVQQPKQVQKSKPPYEPNPWKRQKASKLISMLSLDIRQLIWRELLVAPTPVTVHSNWKSIYPRQKAEISTQLVHVCQAIHQETIPILYGQNTFRYLIRDTTKTSATLANVNHPAHTAGNPGASDDDDADDSGSDWERDCAPALGRKKQNVSQRTTRSAARQKKVVDESDINVEKFACLFRHLMIEAEQSRYQQETQDRMAQAIEFFRFRREGDENSEIGPARLNIQSLTVRVTPSRQRASVHGYTFVDFFEQNSAVINAVKQLDCLSFRIEISRQVLDDDCTASMCRSGEGVTAVEIPFSFQRLAYNIHKFGEEDIWANEPMTQHRRAQRIEMERKRLVSIAEEVKSACQLMDDGKSKDVAESEGAPIIFADPTEDWNAEDDLGSIEDEEDEDGEPYTT